MLQYFKGDEHMEIKTRPLMKNKAFGIFLLIIGIFSVAVILHRLCHYVYEYDAQYSPIDYGRFNIISYFTVESNLFVCFYLLINAFAVLGNKNAQKIAFSPTMSLFVTTYIIVTGVVYCSGIPMGMTPPFKWDNPTHSMSSFIQVYHHMIIPPLMVLLFLFPATNKKTEHKYVWYVGIYPLVYSIFSIIRGAVSDPTFYPYPFYRPEFIWDLFIKNKEMNLPFAYLLMLPVLIVGIGIFIVLARALLFIQDKRKEKM